MANRRRVPKATPANHPIAGSQITFFPLCKMNQSLVTNKEHKFRTKPIQQTELSCKVTLKGPRPAHLDYKLMQEKDLELSKLGKQPTSHPHSPTRINRPHPINVKYLHRLGKSSEVVNPFGGATGANKIVCKVETKHLDDITESVSGSLMINDGFWCPKSSCQESYGNYKLPPESKNTRYGSQKNRSPAHGILPLIKKDGGLMNRDEERMLPGTVAMTTMMSGGGPFHYAPRKRKEAVISRSAAGVVGAGFKVEQYRYYNNLKSRRLVPHIISIPPIV